MATVHTIFASYPNGIDAWAEYDSVTGAVSLVGADNTGAATLTVTITGTSGKMITYTLSPGQSYSAAPPSNWKDTWGQSSTSTFVSS